jgi:diguanylate cyclase (GGDEF)-like protein/PAS domain S-box-containing protein
MGALKRAAMYLRRGMSRVVEPYVLFPAIAVILLGVVWGTTLNLIQVERAAAEKAAMASSQELADTYEAQVLRSLREIDQTLKFLTFAFESQGARLDLADLKRRGLLLPDLLFVVSIADENGRVYASTRPSAGLRDVGSQRFFIAQREGGGIGVSVPAAGGDGDTRLHFSRRLTRPDGAFAGAAIVSVPASYFVSSYEPARMGRHGVLGLLGTDGVYRARRSGDTVAVAGADDYAAAIAHPAGEAARDRLDGMVRLTAARELFDFPLAVVVGLSREEQLAPLAAGTATYVGRAAIGSVVLALLLGGLGWLSWTLSRTRMRANRALQDEVAVRRQAEAALNLRNRAIESSVNAILIIDVRGAGVPIEYVNPAFEAITGFTAAEAVGREAMFLLGDDRDQPALREILLAMQERREARAVLHAHRKDGRPVWNEFYAAPVRDERGEVTHYVAIMNDVTEAKRYEEQLAHQAKFDGLTGLANRNLLQDRLQQSIAAARRASKPLAVAFLDLDHFKHVNDSLGHTAGDALLVAVAERLRDCVRESDTVARLGGDEFVLVLQPGTAADGSSDGDITTLMHKLLSRVGQPFELGGREIRAACSVGVSVYPQDGQTADDLLRNADAAMYRAKELGRSRFQFFTADVHERVKRRMELETSLRLALEREEFELHYQPQVDLRSGAIVGVEALVRWRHPEKGLVGPNLFIPFAEETGLIVPIGQWVLERACRQNKAWQDAGLPAVPIAVNMSARQCEQQDLDQVVRRALQASGLEARYLELEITESISMAHPEQSVPLMHRLKEIGVSLSIDDFGTGFSNLSYLRRFPVDRLKIDLSFVREITTDPGSLAISEAIITMSHSLELQVIAEGVETLGQIELLGARHCDQIQGYFFSPPVPAAAFAHLLGEDRRLAYRAAPRPQAARAHAH